MAQQSSHFTSQRRWRILCAIWIAMIWLHSCIGGEGSAQESGFIVGLLEPSFERLGIVSPQLMNLIVRKSAHVLEYAFLGFTLFKARNPQLSWKNAPVWLLSVLVPLIDETIQWFSPGRSASFWDVLLDACSCLCVLVLAYHQTRRKST